MAISVIKTPNKVSLVGDPVLVEVLSTSHLTQGNATSFTFHITEGLERENFTFIIDGEEFVFPLVSELVSKNDILAESNFTEHANWVNHIFDRFSSNFEIKKRFIWSIDQASLWITMESKEFEDVPLELRSYYNGGLSYHSYPTEAVTQGHTLERTEGYLVGIRLYNENTELIGELVEMPDVDGRVTFEISWLLRSLPEPDFDFDTGMLSFNNGCQAYYYQIYDKAGIPPEEVDKFENGPFYAVFGKTSFMQGAKWNEEHGSFLSEITLHKKFLTLQPNNKKISPFAPELLSFIVLDETLATINLAITFLYTDGTETSVIKSSIGAQYGKMLQVNASPQILEVLKESKSVFSYKVKLQNQNKVDISEERIYLIDYNTYDFTRFFIFRNSYGGGYDCLRSTGQAENTAEIEKEFATSYIPPDYTTKNRKDTQVDAKRTLEFKLNWGLLTRFGGSERDWKNYIQQIELSNDVFEYINALIVPCIFTTEKYDLHNDNRHYYTHTSVYRRAFVDEAYSDDDVPIVADFSDDYNTDFFN